MIRPYAAARRGVLVAGAAAFLVLPTAGPVAAQTPFWDQPQNSQPGSPTSVPTPATPARPAAPAPSGPGRQQPAQAAPAVRKASPTIARIDGKALTQDDFDRVAIPYFARLKAQLGSGFEGDIVKIANHNVLDELLRRELLRLEVRRQKIEASPAEVDTVLSRDPFFWSTGTFDRDKFTMYKTSPTSNYNQMLPQLRELAAMDELDKQLRKRFDPSAAEVRTEWARRNDQIAYKYLALMQRDMPLDSEATSAQVAAYYHAHPDLFMRRTRAHLHYLRLPLPADGDSTRAREEAKAMARAKGVADSLGKRALPDSAAELTDTGAFELASSGIPILGFVPELTPILAKADSEASVRIVGPVTTHDAVIVGVLSGREPKHLPPLAEVLPDVKRQADVEARRDAADRERQAFYAAHPERWRTMKMTVTRISIPDAAIVDKTPTPAEIEKWYKENGRMWLTGRNDSTRPLPALNDTLRLRAKPFVQHAARPALVESVTDRLKADLKTLRDPKTYGHRDGVSAETVTLERGITIDSLFIPPFVDSLYATAFEQRGVVRGSQFLSHRYVVWRVDQVDTSTVPTYDAVRAKVDAAVRQLHDAQDEAEARTWFAAHRTTYKTPVRYAIRYIAVRQEPADSVKISPAELKAEYDKHKDRYRQEEQVKARHILIATHGAGADEKAKARADSLLEAIHHGADFEDLARKFSQDPGAVGSGGDLGWFGRGRMVKEFETAAFALQKGQVSGVVHSQFGYHIIRVDDRRAAGVRPFDDVKLELRTEMAQARADSNARHAAAALSRRLAAGANAPALASAHGGVVTSQPFAANEPVPGLGFVEGLAGDLPSMAAGRWSRKPYRAGNQAVIVALERKVAPGPAAFEDVKAQAIEDMKNDKRKHILDERILTVRHALASGVKLDSVAAPYGGLRDSGLLPANSAFLPMVGFAPHIAKKLFPMKVGATTDTLQTAVGTMWATVTQHKPADAATFKTQKDAIEGELLNDRMNEWLEREKKTARIEVLRADLREPKPGPYKTVTMTGG